MLLSNSFNACSCSCVQLFATPCTIAHQASLSFTISWSLLKLMFIESAMPSNRFILYPKVAVVQSLNCVWLFAIPWTAACQTSLSFTISWSQLMPIELVIPSNHLLLRCPLLSLPSVFPSIRIFSNELAIHIRWPKYWSFSFNISLCNEHSGLISFKMDCLSNIT